MTAPEPAVDVTRSTAGLTVRPASRHDVDAAIPLIYSSGPQAFDFVFSVPGRTSALEFLHAAFIDGRGEFGWRNHTVVEDDGGVVGVGAAWTGHAHLAFALAGLRQIVAHYGLQRGAQVATRGLRVESVIQPPRRDCCYVAHLGVAADQRSRGVGAALVLHLLDRGRRERCRVAELDVATTNPRARALYERLGFVVTRERRSTLSDSRGTVPNHLRMTLRL
jgi:ribosomal protein S18 acetylase RimI-like enzyme